MFRGSNLGYLTPHADQGGGAHPRGCPSSASPGHEAPPGDGLSAWRPSIRPRAAPGRGAAEVPSSFLRGVEVSKNGGTMGYPVISLDDGKSHRSKWKMTGGTPMTKESPPFVDPGVGLKLTTGVGKNS